MGGGVSKQKLEEIERERKELQQQIKALNDEMHSMESNVANLSRDLHNATIENDLTLEMKTNDAIESTTIPDETVRSLMEENSLLSIELRSEVEAHALLEMEKEQLIKDLKEARLALTQKTKRDAMREYKAKKKHELMMKQFRAEAEEKVKLELSQRIEANYQHNKSDIYAQELKTRIERDNNVAANDDELVRPITLEKISIEKNNIKKYEELLIKEKAQQKQQEQQRQIEALQKGYPSELADKLTTQETKAQDKDKVEYLLEDSYDDSNLSFSLTNYDKSMISNTLYSMDFQAENSFSQTPAKKSTLPGGNIENPFIYDNTNESTLDDSEAKATVVEMSNTHFNATSTTNTSTQVKAVNSSFQGRRYSVLVDASSSMRLIDQSNVNGKSRWVQAQMALQLLVPEVALRDEEGITLFFFSSLYSKMPYINTASKVKYNFEGHKPRGGTLLASALDEAIKLESCATSRPEAILVIVDGVPDDRTEVNELLDEKLDLLKADMYSLARDQKKGTETSNSQKRKSNFLKSPQKSFHEKPSKKPSKKTGVDSLNRKSSNSALITKEDSFTIDFNEGDILKAIDDEEDEELVESKQKEEMDVKSRLRILFIQVGEDIPCRRWLKSINNDLVDVVTADELSKNDIPFHLLVTSSVIPNSRENDRLHSSVSVYNKNFSDVYNSFHNNNDYQATKPFNLISPPAALKNQGLASDDDSCFEHMKRQYKQQDQSVVKTRINRPLSANSYSKSYTKEREEDMAKVNEGVGEVIVSGSIENNKKEVSNRQRKKQPPQTAPHYLNSDYSNKYTDEYVAESKQQEQVNIPDLMVIRTKNENKEEGAHGVGSSGKTETQTNVSAVSKSRAVGSSTKLNNKSHVDEWPKSMGGESGSRGSSAHQYRNEEDMSESVPAAPFSLSSTNAVNGDENKGYIIQENKDDNHYIDM